MSYLNNVISNAKGNAMPADKAVKILPYVGDGTNRVLRLRGRLLEKVRTRPAREDDSRWRNLRNIYHRFTAMTVPHAALIARYHDHQRVIHTDSAGYFIVQFDLDTPPPSQRIWHNIHLSYDDGDRQAQAVGKVITPTENAQFGVITDLDDTVWRTDVTNIARMLWNTFTKNPHTRSPFHGVAEFYRALQAGSTQQVFNPIYYVSNSPYSLYDLVEEFLRLRNIPLGPIYLRPVGISTELLHSTDHKFNTIDRLMTLHRDLDFILIGDSGEHDAEIYLKVVQAHPNRIKAIYIRDVNPFKKNTRRDRRVASVAQQAQDCGCDLRLIPDTRAAAIHAAEQGYIHPDALDAVLADVAKDASM